MVNERYRGKVYRYIPEAQHRQGTFRRGEKEWTRQGEREGKKESEARQKD